MTHETEQPIVWVVDDDASIRWVLSEALESLPYEIRTFESPEDALASWDKAPPRAVLTDMRMPGMDGLTFMEALHERRPEIPVIVMTAHADLDTAVNAFAHEAFEYVPKPFEVDEVVALVDRAVRKTLSGGRRRGTRKRTDEGGQLSVQIIGQAPAMQEVFRIIGRVSKLDVTVLINGETGTGKELVARALHSLSPRADKPFVALNTAAIPRELLESELFGHEKGAFTGAVATRIGRFEQAHGGTLFLDEIGDMPVDLQTRLLRVLNDGTFFRVGGRDPIAVNVRILAATHQDMEELVRQGRFREDLLYRLNVIRIKVPPLRERREDIPLLLRHYLAEEARKLGLEEKTLDPAVERYLSQLPWPGNVRQLSSLCTWLTIMAPGKVVHEEDLPLELRETQVTTGGQETGDDWSHALRRWAADYLAKGGNDLHGVAEQTLEKVLIQEALKASFYHKQKAAKRLGWGRNTLTRKLQQLGIE
ncbi:two-component system, NtrC family, nitrogen regulation response regulator GlnG [Sulfurivirga caldicuralii]|uniref:DNA-binding transcriptional regulator NtrC n=1 Tax=Sulfurivirga caldicuralii TaxID=364032 RepID=A0A1N6ER23_9GAMM|nr:nitrogen regulation protein NR(I) [Sulfurivirga caldicuralii]SIN85465.1 two-component system, NtrC family, nitrogen regulation response regulator GlnG [Sulfurivirga caldicuralii]